MTTGLRHDHHGHDFTGPLCLALGLMMAVGRGDVARLVADLAGVTSGDHVVDVGAGPGTAAREAARRGATVTAVDPSAEMRRLARWFTPSSLPLTVVDGRAEALPVADGAASVVWAISSAHHWSDVDAALREVRRVLAPGGRLVIVERVAGSGPRWLEHHTVPKTNAEELAAKVGGTVSVETAGRKRLVVVRAIMPG